mmetsp:Transcript_20146/g.49360  ORF Transcript_20146/g.49360 Transcript_20146/m.49360 type:complete len:203 (-) Transcript_20146:39-647(-)
MHVGSGGGWAVPLGVVSRHLHGAALLGRTGQTLIQCPAALIQSTAALHVTPGPVEAAHANGQHFTLQLCFHPILVALGLDSVLAHGEAGILLLLLECLLAGFELGQSSADGSSLFRSQVEGFVLFVLVVDPQILSLCLRNNSQDSRNRLSHFTNFRQLGRRICRHRRHTQLRQLGLQVLQLLCQLWLALRPQIVRFHFHHGC